MDAHIDGRSSHVDVFFLYGFEKINHAIKFKHVLNELLSSFDDFDFFDDYHYDHYDYYEDYYIQEDTDPFWEHDEYYESDDEYNIASYITPPSSPM